MTQTDRSLQAQGPMGSGAGSSTGRPIEPSPSDPPETPPRPGEREAPAPGTPVGEAERRRLKEQADKPERPTPNPQQGPGQRDSGR
jgi:hypothetical protein